MGASAVTSLLLCFPTGRQTAFLLLRCASSQQAPNNEGNKSWSPATLNLIKPFLSSRWLPQVFLTATESWLIHPYLLYEREVNGGRITETVRTKKLKTVVLKSEYFTYIIFCLCLCMGVGVGSHGGPVEDNLQEVAVFFRDWALVVKLGGKCHYLLSHLVGPYTPSIKFAFSQRKKKQRWIMGCWHSSIYSPRFIVWLLSARHYPQSKGSCMPSSSLQEVSGLVG